MLLYQLTRKTNQLLCVAYFTMLFFIGITIEQITCKRDFTAQAPPKNVANRLTERLALQIQTSKFQCCKSQHVAEKFQSCWRSELPANSLQLKRIFTDQLGTHLRQLPFTTWPTITFAETNQAFISDNFHDEPGKAGMRAKGITKW